MSKKTILKSLVVTSVIGLIFTACSQPQTAPVNKWNDPHNLDTL